jgi:hypothetical protein
MNPQTFVLPAAADRTDVLGKILRFAHQLGVDKRWRVTIEPFKKTRSSSQNAYLWGAVYPLIIKAANLDGWTADDVHEFFLGEHFGWEYHEGFGRKKAKPVRRSSKLSTIEFNEHVEFIQRFMAERGVYVPDPNEEPDESKAGREKH